jgi:MoaA/NifB/PqqE/SkfB family radical SAM enzyme
MDPESLPTAVRGAFEKGVLLCDGSVVRNRSGCELPLSRLGLAGLQTLFTRVEHEPFTLSEAALLQLLAFCLLDKGRLASAIDYATFLESPVNFVQPAEVSFEITKLCNLTCLHCYNDSGRRDPAELSGDEKVKLADYLGRWGVRRISITGGEPTLDPSFPALLSAARDNGITAKITTNGWKLPPALLAAIDAGVALHVNISLDGADAATHDTFRGRRGSYNRVLRSMRILSDCRPRILQLNVSVHSGSLYQMEALARLALECRFDAISFKPVTSGGRPGGGTDFLLSPADLHFFRAQRASLGAGYGDRLHVEGNILGGAAPKATLDRIKCNAAERSMLILSNGAMTPCSALNADGWAPNVRTMSPMQAWLGHPLFNGFRSTKRTAGNFLPGCPGVRFASMPVMPGQAAPAMPS